MAECFMCGVSDDKVLLFDAISGEGIVKICQRCSDDEDMPLIKKSLGFSKAPELRRQETDLRKLVEKNIPVKEKKEFPDLIDNFHWIVMRARRLRHLTQEQLGKEIGESEKTIKTAEQGFLPDNYYELIKKIEGRLGIRLFKKEAAERMKEHTQKLGFDPLTTKSLTISDLQDMKKKRESEILEEDEYSFNEDAEENEPEFIWRKKTKDRDDLSEDEMNDLIFRK